MPHDPDVDASAYHECYVAFIDILGFSALVRQAHDTEIRESIEGLIREMQKAGDAWRGVQSTQFSDCIVVSTERSVAGLGVMLTACRILAEVVMLHGCLVRGGIACGMLKHTANLVYGPGLLDAHSHDARGGAPRLVVDPVVAADIANGGSSWMADRAIRLDEADGATYLHTLLAVEHYGPDEKDEPFPAGIWQMPSLIAIMCNDRAVNQDVRSKWEWFRAYWNETVGRAHGRYC